MEKCWKYALESWEKRPGQKNIFRKTGELSINDCQNTLPRFRTHRYFQIETDWANAETLWQSSSLKISQDPSRPFEIFFYKRWYYDACKGHYHAVKLTLWKRCIEFYWIKNLLKNILLIDWSLLQYWICRNERTDNSCAISETIS